MLWQHGNMSFPLCTGARLIQSRPNVVQDMPSDSCQVQEHQTLNGKELYFSSAQLTQQHSKEELQNQSLLVVANFPRKQIGPRMSDCLITGAQIDSSDSAEKTASTVFVTFSHPVEPGQLVSIDGKHQSLKLYAAIRLLPRPTTCA